MPAILSVDDSAIVRKIIRGAVEALGYEFYEAKDGQEAIDLLHEHLGEIELILLDWNMPIKDGYETLNEVKNDPALKHIPVMMVTTESERMNVIKALQAGANHYLTKPFNQSDMMTRMLECMGQGTF